MCASSDEILIRTQILTRINPADNYMFKFDIKELVLRLNKFKVNN